MIGVNSKVIFNLALVLLSIATTTPCHGQNGQPTTIGGVERAIFGNRTLEEERQLLTDVQKWAESGQLVDIHLSESQIAKLRLGARGDETRFMRDYQANLSEIQRKLSDNSVGQLELGSIINDLRMRWNLVKQLRGPLVTELIPQVLTDEQKTKLMTSVDAIEQKRNLYEVMKFVEQFELSAPLVDRQRTAMTMLMVDKIESVHPTSELRPYLAMYAAMNMDAKEFEKILDAKQMAVLNQLVRHWQSNIPKLVEVKIDENQRLLEAVYGR